MISHLRISAFATIEEMSVSFEEGLTVITGETGAGKSLLVDALFLVSGQKPRGLTVRPGCTEGVVEAAFTPPVLPIPESLSEVLDPEEDIVIRRVVTSSGRFRQTVNGQPVSGAQLQALVDILFDIVGQGENHRLSRSEAHRSYLDAFAGTSGLAESYEILRREIMALRRERDEISLRRERDLREREERIRMQEDREQLAGRPGEFEELSQTLSAQLNLQEILLLAGRSYGTLYEDDQSVLALLGRIISDLDHILSMDPTLAGVRTSLVEAAEILKDGAHELLRYRESLEMDPDRLAVLEARFSLYRRLAQKYHVRPEELVGYLDQAAIADAGTGDQALEEIDTRIRESQERLLEIGKTLGERRRTASEGFSAAVCALLRRLRIDHPSFTVSLAPYPDPLGGPFGRERVEFLFSANPGMPESPLGQVASGGEISRVLLAIKAVLSDCDQVPTLVFDEIDSGIGGEVGEVLGDLLKEIGRGRQVLAITHLHQVARKGDHHLLVHKLSEGGHTRSRIAAIEGEDRVREIARMLGGEKISPSAMTIARDLLG
ncbi:MAG: DNA repair protein RecN [Nitrospirae bacterium]|nr:DNA repair protein RecN [Nitrospirota bacterium]MCL5285623.1 DNA repair protein RecN [Nitrospirota bacterium]